jgi:hypothetical protein
MNGGLELDELHASAAAAPALPKAARTHTPFRKKCIDTYAKSTFCPDDRTGYSILRNSTARHRTAA